MTLQLADWLPHAVVGTTFLAFGLAKVYGLSRCIVGGRGKTWTQRACGVCPSWSRQFNLAVIGLFLAIGVGNLVWLAWILALGSRT